MFNYQAFADAAFGFVPPAKEVAPTSLASPIEGVTDEQWTAFVNVMITAPLSSVSPSNEIGLFEMKPRRLDDLGLISKLKRCKSPRSKRQVYAATFKPPLTAEMFLKSPTIQFVVFSHSMQRYSAGIVDGTIKKKPEMSLAGALAVLHKAGPKGLETWEKAERFPKTQAAFDAADGIF